MTGRYLMHRNQRREKRNLYLRAARLHGDLIDVLRSIRSMSDDLTEDYDSLREEDHRKLAQSIVHRLSEIEPMIKRQKISDILHDFNRLPEEIT